MSFFETNPKPLKLLLTQIHNGELVLPDFQRDFVWDPGATEELVESIMRNYPAGSLLFLQHSGEGFQVREFEGAPSLKSAMSTNYLVLDGQQRMTSLYQAFFGKGEHRFFLDIKELIESGDIESAVWHESEKRCHRQGLLKLETQAERLICPLHVVMGNGFATWVDDIMELRPEKGDSGRELRSQLRQVNKDWVQPILDYQFPVVTFDYLVRNKVDDHHIFPQNFMKKTGDRSKVNCVLNRTLIDKKTNIRISDKAPSVYLEEIESEIGSNELRAILESHLINMDHLEADDFESFIEDRARNLMAELKDRMKRDIPASPVAYVTEELEFDEDEEKVNPREKFDPALINAHPTELLADLPEEIEKIFTAFTKQLLSERQDTWWKANARKVVFWSPNRVFATCRISRTGLHFVVFTDNKPLDGVDPIMQKDNGGKLWGRIKLKHIADLNKVIRPIFGKPFPS